MKANKQKRYQLTEFYCEIHKVWHRITDDKFHRCIDLYNAHYSFKVSPFKTEAAREDNAV